MVKTHSNNYMHTPRLQRFEAFSDGVMAIAITLLALELKVTVLTSTTFSEGVNELIPYLPHLLTFALSFLTIAIFWVNHHQMTEHIEFLNRRVIWANMLFLMFQTLIPFATRVIAANSENFLNVATYSFILFCGSLSFALLHYLVHKKINHNIHINGKMIRRSLVGPLLYGLAIVASFYFVPISYVLLAIPPLYYFLPKSVQE